MKPQYVNEIKGILLLALSIIFFASLVSYTPEDLPWFTDSPNIPVKNFVSIVGAYAAGIFFFALGYSAYLIVVILFLWSWSKFLLRDVNFSLSKNKLWRTLKKRNFANLSKKTAHDQSIDWSHVRFASGLFSDPAFFNRD